MESRAYVGRDIHRENLVATAVTPDGERISRVTLGSSREELTRYLEDLPGEE